MGYFPLSARRALLPTCANVGRLSATRGRFKAVLKLQPVARPVGSNPDPDARTVQREREVEEAILGYLDEHPHAMDSIEGIAEWWVSRARIRRDVTLVLKVLDQLTASGVLESVGSGDQKRYRLRSDLTRKNSED